MNIQEVNELVKTVNTNEVSDGYHTFGELYEHRITLYIALCRLLDDTGIKEVWKSKTHADGSSWEGWFVLGIGSKDGEQITYHLPMSKWGECEFANERQPETFDGHTSADVLERLKQL